MSKFYTLLSVFAAFFACVAYGEYEISHGEIRTDSLAQPFSLTEICSYKLVAAAEQARSICLARNSRLPEPHYYWDSEQEGCINRATLLFVAPHETEAVKRNMANCRISSADMDSDRQLNGNIMLWLDKLGLPLGGSHELKVLPITQNSFYSRSQLIIPQKTGGAYLLNRTNSENPLDFHGDYPEVSRDSSPILAMLTGIDSPDSVASLGYKAFVNQQGELGVFAPSVTEINSHLATLGVFTFKLRESTEHIETPLTYLRGIAEDLSFPMASLPSQPRGFAQAFVHDHFVHVYGYALACSDWLQKIQFFVRYWLDFYDSLDSESKLVCEKFILNDIASMIDGFLGSLSINFADQFEYNYTRGKKIELEGRPGISYELKVEDVEFNPFEMDFASYLGALSNAYIENHLQDLLAREAVNVQLAKRVLYRDKFLDSEMSSIADAFSARKKELGIIIGAYERFKESRADAMPIPFPEDEDVLIAQFQQRLTELPFWKTGPY